MTPMQIGVPYRGLFLYPLPISQLTQDLSLNSHHDSQDCFYFLSLMEYSSPPSLATVCYKVTIPPVLSCEADCNGHDLNIFPLMKSQSEQFPLLHLPPVYPLSIWYLMSPYRAPVFTLKTLSGSFTVPPHTLDVSYPFFWVR